MENSKTIITPISKTKIVMKEWITGAEFNKIQEPITNFKMIIDGKGGTKGEINAGECNAKSIELAIDTVIIKVEGGIGNKVNNIENLRKQDYDFVLEEVNKVIKGETFINPS